jgi:hypothetical protein
MPVTYQDLLNPVWVVMAVQVEAVQSAEVVGA